MVERPPATAPPALLVLRRVTPAGAEPADRLGGATARKKGEEQLVMAQEKQTESGQKSGKQGNGSHRGALTRPRGGLMSGGFMPLNRLRSEFDRVFDDFFHGWPSMGSLGSFERENSLQLEVQDMDDKFVVRADAPGFEPKDFDVEIRGDNLVISASQSEEEEAKEGQGYRWQRRDFYRSIPLTTDIDEEKIDAEYRNGVLTLTLPKSEQAKAKKIEIKG
jgi:HSP20 family protein